MSDLRRVALVTGAGQGLGRAAAMRLAADGLQVVVSDVDAGRAGEVAEEISRATGRALALELDVTDERSVARGVETCVDRAGGIEVLVNNAARFSTITMKPFEEIPLTEWRDVMQVNLDGMFVCARAVAPVMRAARRGRIIGLSSATVLMGRPWYLHYVTSKSGVIGFTRALARELGEYGITVNAIMPGATRTEVPRHSIDDDQLAAIVAQQSIHEPLMPDDIAAVVAFLAREECRLMTGQTLVVDGGLNFV